MPGAPTGSRRRAAVAKAQRQRRERMASRHRGRFVVVAPSEDVVVHAKLADKAVITRALVDLLLAILDTPVKQS
jgi:hypothetical protein